MNLKTIALRAVVTAFEATLGVLLASGLTDLSADAVETAAVAGLAAGLSVAYNAATRWLAENSG